MESEDGRAVFLMQNAIPASLLALASKQEDLTKVIQQLEESYSSATEDKYAIETQAKESLINALTSVATDIESAASGIDNLLALQLSSIESMIDQVELIQSKLRLGREQTCLTSFQDMCLPTKTLAGASFREIESPSLSTATHTARIDIATRLTQLDQVGVSVPRPLIPSVAFRSSTVVTLETNNLNDSVSKIVSPQVVGRAGTARAGLNM